MEKESMLNNSMSSDVVSLCVKQIFPSGDSTNSCISLHTFNDHVPYDVLLPILSSEISEWLSDEIFTGSSFEFKISFKFAK